MQTRSCGAEEQKSEEPRHDIAAKEPGVRGEDAEEIEDGFVHPGGAFEARTPAGQLGEDRQETEDHHLAQEGGPQNAQDIPGWSGGHDGTSFHGDFRDRGL